MINCNYCNSEIAFGINICPNCQKFLHRGVLKEILRIIKRYLDRRDYYSIRDILAKAQQITKDTKYEKYIISQINENEQNLKKIKEQYSSLYTAGKEFYANGEYLKALETYRKLLNLPLLKNEQIKVETEILRAKAKIYNFEMQDLFADQQQTPFAF